MGRRHISYPAYSYNALRLGAFTVVSDIIIMAIGVSFIVAVGLELLKKTKIVTIKRSRGTNVRKSNKSIRRHRKVASKK